ncbi:MAG: putative recombination protein (RmuC family) [Rickettsiales bacterium]|jgi:DNA recombination protein RmuC|nr:putative recombination protein (RmuC family) [Rickettsiales bacterium]
MIESLLVPFFAVLSAAAAGSALFFFVKNQQHRLRLESLEPQLHTLLQEKQSLQSKLETYIADRTEAVTRMETTLSQYNAAVKERDLSRQEARSAEDQRQEAIRYAELANQRVREMQERMQDWEKTKQEHFKLSKEAMFETGTEAFRQQAEISHEKTMKEFLALTEKVAGLSSRVGMSENKTDTVWRALTSPGGAGQMAEIGLENTLKQFGLEPGRDFITQYSVSGEETGSKLRPDAVVFLPKGTLLIIDSKASKFFIELAQVEGSEQEEFALGQLRKTMHEHLRALHSKGYREAVKEYERAGVSEHNVTHIISVMYLPSEAAIDKLIQADSTFRFRAQELGIIVAGPTGLAGLMSLAHAEISRDRQEKNYDAIVHEFSTLMGNLGVVLQYAFKVGLGIQRAAESYQNLSRSVNGRLLPKMKKLTKMGVGLPKNKELPANLPDYHISVDKSPVIEGEAEDMEGVDEPLRELGEAA